MLPLRHLLCLPLLVGLLQPPGMCLCDLAELLTHEFHPCDAADGSESPGHDETCPCVKMPGLASGRGSAVEAPAGTLTFAMAPCDVALLTTAVAGTPIQHAHHPPSQPIYLILRALRN